MGVAAIVALSVVFVVLVLATFPPRSAPRWWRRATRPLRRLLRPGHYRTW
jgi:hypothetical protein